MQTKPKNPRTPFDRVSLGILIVFALLALGGGYAAFRLSSNLTAGMSMINLPGKPVDTGTGATLSPDSTAMPPTPPALSGPMPEPWDGKSRINMLIMGLDYRDWEKGETPRTDTMMLLTLDPVSKTAGMLSIPRDMWVNIPGFDYARINTAYFLGESYKVPGGGPALAAQTVEAFLGVPVQYYAQIDFYAFVKFIDDLGGLDMKIRKEIKVDPLGKGNTVILKPGTQPLSGDVVLAYARQRYTEGGDFDRAQRQQEVIMAIRKQILTLNMMPTLVAKSPQIYADISSGIRTNLSLDQVIQMSLLALQVPEENIRKGVISPPNQVLLDQSPDGQAILKPIPDQIRVLRDEIFASGGPVGPAAVASDPAALVKAEAARVIVKNGSQQSDLSVRTATFLQSQGINVVQEGLADQGYQTSYIIIYSGKPYTISYLAKLLNIQTNTIVNRYTPDAPADIEIILGSDWGQNNSLP